MKKSIYILLTTVILIFSLSVPSLCAKNVDKLTFTDEQNKTIDDITDEITATYGIEVYFIYDSSVTGSDQTINLAQNTYNVKTKSADGLCLSVTKDYFYFYKVGKAKDLLSESAEDRIFKEMKSHTDSFYNYTVTFFSSLNTELSNYKSSKSYVVDIAELLSESEKTELETQLNMISTHQNFDVVVVTTNTLEGKTAEEYADDFYDYNNYGQGENKDGCLLLVSIEDRDWHISTKGFGITALTDAGITYLSNQFLSDLSEGNYFNAFTIFGDKVDEFLTKAKTGSPYDINNIPQEPRHFSVKTVGIGLVFGVIVAFAVVGYYTSKLKSVRSKRESDEYLVQGSFVVTGAFDNFIRSDVVRTAKPEKSSSGGSSTHTSSSGSSHGGGGGKF